MVNLHSDFLSIRSSRGCSNGDDTDDNNEPNHCATTVVVTYEFHDGCIADAFINVELYYGCIYIERLDIHDKYRTITVAGISCRRVQATMAYSKGHRNRSNSNDS